MPFWNLWGLRETTSLPDKKRIKISSLVHFQGVGQFRPWRNVRWPNSQFHESSNSVVAQQGFVSP